jgi:steroid 5-alpha reductase family enzyme
MHAANNPHKVLLFTITTPTYALLLSSKIVATPNALDIVFSSFIVGLVALTGAADQQQWNYQNAKHLYRDTNKLTPGYTKSELERGFLTSGLFKYSRHPNFAAEQSVWITLYLWACQITETYVNWTFVGPFLYLCLFQASTWFTEIVSARKYPEYKQYQKNVGMFVPGPSINWTREETKAPVVVNGAYKKKA